MLIHIANNKRLQSLLIILVLAVVAVAGLLLLMGGLASSDSTTMRHSDSPPAVAPTSRPQAATSTPSQMTEAEDETAVTVNDEIITGQVWQQAARLDMVMSELAHQPAPSAEQTLDRLINEIIILQAVEEVPPVTEAEVEAKIQALSANWNITEQTMVTVLEQAGLKRTDLSQRVARLLQVEVALSQLAGQESDFDRWLAEARASAEIGLYQPLRNLSPTEAAAEEKEDPVQPVQKLTESKPEPPSDMPTAPYPENAAPDFTVSLLDGESLNLTDLRGKPALINFWASWCRPCRRELPALQAAYTKYGDHIGFIAVDVQEGSSKIAPLVAELGLTFPVGLDQEGEVSYGAYEVRGLPTTIFVDARGVVVARHVGPLTEEAIDDYLEPLLAQANEPLDNALEDDLMAGEESSEILPDSISSLPAAPDFALTAADGRTVSLQDYQGQRNLVLVFYRGRT